MSKPNWENSPAWANWLAQDADGMWFWWHQKPVSSDDNVDFWLPAVRGKLAKFQRSKRDKPPVNWKTTLEPRP